MSDSSRDFLFENLVSDMEKNGNYKGILGNLLAILNGDGGHFQEKYGLTCAVMNGIDRFHNRKTNTVADGPLEPENV